MARKTLRQWCEENWIELLDHMVYQDTADTFTYASHYKVQWVCDKGHYFDKEPHHYTTGYSGKGKKFRCPVCNGRRVQQGYNDLATDYPELAKEWHPTLNNQSGLTPFNITGGSYYSVWWMCEDGHEWNARISSRALDGRGCPMCSNSNRTSMREQYLVYYIRKHLNVYVYNNYSIDGVEFDIYIPSLNTAIEYDGMYWHASKDTSHKDILCKTKGIIYYKIIESDRTERIDNYFYYKYFNSVRQDMSFVSVIYDIIKVLGYSGEPDIDLERDYRDVVTSYKSRREVLEQSTVVKKVIDNFSEYWDEQKNGYSIDYVKNDGYDKWWKCKNGHRFQRRIDVMLRNNVGVNCKMCRLGDSKAIIYCMRFYLSFIFTNLREWIPHHGYRAYAGLIDENIVLFHTEHNENIQKNLNNLMIHSFCGSENKVYVKCDDIIKVQVYSSWLDYNRLTESTKFLLRIIFDNTPYRISVDNLNFTVDVERDLEYIIKVRSIISFPFQKIFLR